MPPKESNAISNGNITENGKSDLVSIAIPLVISREGRKSEFQNMDVIGSSRKRDRSTENNIIYPPTFVMISKLFMMV